MTPRRGAAREDDRSAVRLGGRGHGPGIGRPLGRRHRSIAGQPGMAMVLGHPGKVQLALLPPDERERFFTSRELHRFTPKTVTDPAAFRGHLETIASQGFAVDDEELEAGVRGVAAPIINYEDRVVGAIIISGPASQTISPALILSASTRCNPRVTQR